MTLVAYSTVIIIELLLLLGIAFYAIGLLYSGIMGAPYVPTSKKQVKDILKKAELKPGQIFMELGSGDGRVVREAVKHYRVRGIGIDANNLLVILSRLYAKREKISSVEFRKQNMFETDLKDVDVLYLFLMPELLKKMNAKFLHELKPGALVISHGFRLEGWSDKQVDEIKSEPFSTYYYRI